MFRQFDGVALLGTNKTRGSNFSLPLSQSHKNRNFSDTSSVKSRQAKGSIGHAFTVCIRTENQNQMRLLDAEATALHAIQHGVLLAPMEALRV